MEERKCKEPYGGLVLREFQLLYSLLQGRGLVMNGALGCTSMTGFGGFRLSGFSLCTALFDVGELRRGNTEEYPWLGMSVGLRLLI
jgi:hypothetical protein